MSEERSGVRSQSVQGTHGPGRTTNSGSQAPENEQEVLCNSRKAFVLEQESDQEFEEVRTGIFHEQKLSWANHDMSATAPESKVMTSASSQVVTVPMSDAYIGYLDNHY